MAMDLELSITGSEPGKVDQTMYCYVMNLDDPLHLHVEAEFKVNNCLNIQKNKTKIFTSTFTIYVEILARDIQF